MQSYKLSQDDVIMMLANKANLPEDTARVLRGAEVAPITDMTGYCDDHGVSKGRPPLLKGIDRILGINPQLLRWPDHDHELVASIQTSVKIFGVEIVVPIYLCELKYVKVDMCLHIDNLSFYKRPGDSWQLHIS